MNTPKNSFFATVLQRLAGVLVVLTFAGCAAFAPPHGQPQALEGTRTHWSGRLALQVEGATARERGQTVAAHFDLSGNAGQGELRLYSPVGSTLAHIVWDEHGASLDDGKQIHMYPSLDALLASTGEAAVPAAALFQWLQGIDTPVDGWYADLSQLSRGRISAQRLQPLPRAYLRLVLAED